MNVYVTTLYIGLILPSVRCCEEGFYKCTDDNRCISEVELCDGFFDCHDHQDEEIGCTIKFNCTDSKFLCRNYECISERKRCDGIFDCTDNSDEDHCENYCQTQHGKYLCKDRSKCIDLKKVCDNSPDCLDESDEGELCSELLSKPCKCDKCVHTPKGILCICDRGYKAMYNDRCDDEDECLNESPCDHICKNTPGSYICSCLEGFKLKSDGRSCSVLPEDHGMLFAYSTLQKVEFHFMKKNSAFDFMDFSLSLDNNGCTTHIVQSSPNSWSILQFNQDNVLQIYEDVPHHTKLNDKPTRLKTLPDICSSFTQIVADILKANFYFVCPQEGIMVCTYDLSSCFLSRTSETVHVKSVAVASGHRLLFWLETDTSSDYANIIRAGLNGSNKTVILHDILGSYYTEDKIAVDDIGGRVYFFRVITEELQSVKFDGTGRRTVRKNIRNPSILAAVDGVLYWTQKNQSGIFTGDKFSINSHKIFSNDSSICQVVATAYPGQLSLHDENIIGRRQLFRTNETITLVSNTEGKSFNFLMFFLALPVTVVFGLTAAYLDGKNVFPNRTTFKRFPDIFRFHSESHVGDEITLI